LDSDNFINSEYCWKIERREALKRERENRAFVIPIVLSQCNWKRGRLAKLLALPDQGQPLLDAFGGLNAHHLENVIEGLRLALLGLWQHSNSASVDGATIRSVSAVGAPRFPFVGSAVGRLMAPTSAYEPVNIKGVKVRYYDLEDTNFIVDVGQNRLSGEPLRSEGQKVIDFFGESFSTDVTNVWVNFSPCESNRMLPDALAGTELGKALLEIDYRLKLFSASCLHPDSAIGRAYWNELYQRSHHEFGSSNIPFQSYQKVTISAGGLCLCFR
jgi:hypothetical protein